MEAVAAKRSPILGYNHNVRYRGIVFHVQTEDSGIINPHVFTHLFHGGVIISTRKLVYDREASEEAVKSLMQAQHKAVMKDLKNLVFDDKIDQYLAGTPGLMPREDAAGAAEPVMADAPTPPARAPSQPQIPAAPSEVDAAPTIPIPVEPTPLGRAPTERVREIELDAELPSPEDRAGGPPTPARTDISAAMAALQVGDDELAAAGLVEIDVAEIHSPAPPSAPPPPGAAAERPGQYSVTKRTTGVIDAVSSPQRPPIPAAPRPTPSSGSKLPAAGPLPPRAPTPPVVPPRTATPPISRPTPTSVPRLNPQNRPADPALPGTPPASPPRTPGAPIPRPTAAAPPPRGRPPTGGGVVVSRPPVIVGGPSKTVGAPGTQQGKVRRAKETEGGIGGDLISERSLDEVILAYLSEDTSDE